MVSSVSFQRERERERERERKDICNTDQIHICIWVLQIRFLASNAEFCPDGHGDPNHGRMDVDQNLDIIHFITRKQERGPRLRIETLRSEYQS